MTFQITQPGRHIRPSREHPGRLAHTVIRVRIGRLAIIYQWWPWLSHWSWPRVNSCTQRQSSLVAGPLYFLFTWEDR